MPRPAAVVLALVGLIVAAQIAVPAWGLFNKPARFGWQMYAEYSTELRLTLVYASGERRSLSLGDLNIVANYRIEVAYEQQVPPRLCARDPRLQLVLVKRERPSVDLRHRCSNV